MGVQVLAERYRLVELIGSGGMAVVWRAFDEVLGRQVAVKVLTSDNADDPDFRRRIRDEARAAARLAHPHVSVVHDYGEWADANDAVMPYVVMELIEGPSLSDVLAGGPLPWSRAASIVAQVASGLAAAHVRGLVHRDVKPANVVLAPTGAKLVDFGISAIAGDSRSDGELLGTPAYVSPERLIGGPTSTSADVYALGVLLYRAIAGRLPWLTEEHSEMLLAHLNDEPEPLPEAAAGGAPPELAALCLRCLAKDPGARPTAAEVARELTALAGVSDAIAAGTAGPHAAGTQTTILPVLRLDRPSTSAARRLHVPTRTAAYLTLATPRHVAEAGSDHPPWRRSAVLVAFAGAVLIAGIAVVAAVHREDPAGGAASAAGPGEVQPAAATMACQAIYQVRQDDGARFTGDLTIVNSGSTSLRDWTVSFHYPGGQRAAGRGWRQSGDAVSRGPVSDELPAGEQVTYPFQGTYRDVNPMPLSFMVDQVACATRLVGAVGPGEPAGGTAAGGPAPEGNSGPGGPAEPKPGKSKGKGKGHDDAQ
jgi:serine/threonine-protein kinase